MEDRSALSIRTHSKKVALALLLGAGLGALKASAAEIVRYVDARGRIVFYYRPDAEVLPRALGSSRVTVDRENALLPTIERIATEHAVDPLLVRAVMRVESNFHSSAVSPKGATGLMQLMPVIAAYYGVEDTFDVEQNIRGGVRFLQHLRSRYGDNLEALLAAYNAGETAVERAGGTVPAIRETQQYVVDVLHHYRKRGGLVPDLSAPRTELASAQARPALKPAVARRRAPEPVSRPIRVRVDSKGNLVLTNVP